MVALNWRDSSSQTTDAELHESPLFSSLSWLTVSTFGLGDSTSSNCHQNVTGEKNCYETKYLLKVVNISKDPVKLRQSQTVFVPQEVLIWESVVTEWKLRSLRSLDLLRIHEYLGYLIYKLFSVCGSFWLSVGVERVVPWLTWSL